VNESVGVVLLCNKAIHACICAASHSHTKQTFPVLAYNSIMCHGASVLSPACYAAADTLIFTDSKLARPDVSRSFGNIAACLRMLLQRPQIQQ